MSYAPRTLLDTRHVYQEYTGLPDVEVGIVGDTAHDGGYHQGWDNRRISNGQLNDYSWEESSRDWSHKTNAASAIDFGWFDKVIGGKRVTLIDFNLWMVKELEAGAPDTLDIRSFIYTPDGVNVKRWDRLKKRNSGDKSHLKHSHCSRFRDAENKPLAPLVQRFFRQYVKGSIDMFMLKVIGDQNPSIYISDGLNTRPLPEGQWGLTGGPLKAAGVPLLEYPDMPSLLKGGGPLVKPATDGGSTPVVGTANVTGGTLTFGPVEE
jgi:hypothetical protein